MKSCPLTALYDYHRSKSLQWRSTSNFNLEREALKNDGGKSGQHWELKLVLHVPGDYIFIFNGCRCSCCIVEDLEFRLNPLSKDITTPWSISRSPHSIFIGIKVKICCSHIMWRCVGFFLQLCHHNIVIKLRHNLIDDGPCVNSLYVMQFS